MSFLEKYRKAKVVLTNTSRAFGAVGNELSGGFLGGKKHGSYEPVRYKPLPVKAASHSHPKKSFARRVGKALGDVSQAHSKYGFNGSPGYGAAQNQFFTGSSGGGRVGRAQRGFFEPGMKSTGKSPRNAGEAGSVGNPFFKFGKV